MPARIRLLILLLLCCVTLAPVSAATAPGDIWSTLERLEDVRLLFHTAMWQVYEARALEMANAPVTGVPTVSPDDTGYIPLQTSYQRFRLPAGMAECDDLTKEGLWLYERVMSLDEAGQSLCSYRDSKKAPFLQEDLRLLESQTAMLARDVLAYYAKTHAAREARRNALTDIMPSLRAQPGIPWTGAEREWGRQAGFSIGWPMLMRPYDDSAQAQLNAAHGLGTDYLLRKAKKVGVGHIYILDPDAASWRGCELKPGMYDFTKLDAMLAEVKAAGLKAVIFIPSLTTGCPDWFKATEKAEVSFVGSNQTVRSGVGLYADIRRGRDEFAFLQEKGRDKVDESVNLYNPAVASAFSHYLQALGAHLQGRWRDTLLAVQLETNICYFLTRTGGKLSTDVDYSRFARVNWQDWLRARYPTVEALNATWKSGFTAFDQIDLLQPITFTMLQIAHHGTGSAAISPESRKYLETLSPRQWHDFLDWRDDYITHYFKQQKEALQRGGLAAPVIVDVKDLDGHIPLLDRPEFGWNAADLAQQVADLPEHMGSAEWADNLLRAYAGLRNPDCPTWVANQGEKTFGALITQSITGPFYKDAIMLNHRFGPGEVLRNFHDIGAYNYLDQQLNTDGANSWFLAMREDHAVAPEILNTRVARGQVAVLWPESTFRADPDAQALREAECWGDALHAIGYAYDYVFVSQLTPERLSGYAALVLPAAWCLSDAAEAVIRSYVESGGILIATSTSGLRDELGRSRIGWPLGELFGVKGPTFIPATAVVNTPLGVVQPEGWWEMDNIRQSAGDLTYGNRLCCTFAEVAADAQVRGRFTDERPAIVGRRVGKGQTLLLGYPFGNEYGWSNYNEIGFGKIHGDTAELTWQRQLEAWLRGQMQGLGLRPRHEAIRAVTLRPNGRELEAPTLGYPQGGSTWENYMYNVDEPDRTIEFTLREREGISTRYLCVWNREAQYGASRGYVHHFAAPKFLTVRLNLPDVQAVYDVSLQTPVRFTREGNAIVFRTCLAPCMGRVFAISTEKEITRFAGERSRGISDEELLASTRATAAGTQQAAPVLVLHEAEIKAYLASLRGKAVRIGCGSPAYLEIGQQLAAALKTRLGCTTSCTLAGVQYGAERERHRFPNYTVQEMPEIFLGNEWDNQCLAYFTATAWTAGRSQNLFLPLPVNKALPGPGRGVLQLSRPYQVIDRHQRPAADPAFYRFDSAPTHLVIGGSDVAGTALALKACLQRLPKK